MGIVRLAARLRDDHGYDVALRELLADPSVASIADRVVAGKCRGGSARDRSGPQRSCESG
ncbi:hypothetical protein GS448_26130 [Rhodococcus hoagii]|nr:hypothetical protein [Prescottella equi]